MTVYGVDAKFSATWTSAGDFLARIGLAVRPDEDARARSEPSPRTSRRQRPAATAWSTSESTGGRSVRCASTTSSTTGGARSPPTPPPTGRRGPRWARSPSTADSYDVWKHTQTNKPAITGDNQTFDQYFSVRQTARQCGHISISEHFSQWTTLGLQLGKLEEAKLLVEAQNSTGTIDFTTATVVVK